MLKPLFQDLQVRPTTPGRDSRPPGAQLETSKNHCVPGRDGTAAAAACPGQLTAQATELQFFKSNFP